MDPIVALLSRKDQPAAISPYTRTETSPLSHQVVKQETIDGAPLVYQDVLSTNRSLASVLLADIDAAIGVLAPKLGENVQQDKKNRPLVVAELAAGENGSIAGYLKDRNESITLHDSLMGATIYDLIFSHSTSVLTHWRMLKLLQTKEQTVLVLFVNDLNDKSVQGLILTLALFGTIYAFKPLALETGVAIVVKKIDSTKLRLFTKNLVVEPEQVDEPNIKADWTSAQKKKAEREHQKAINETIAVAKEIEDQSVVIYDEVPNSLQLYLQSVKDVNYDDIVLSPIDRERLLVYWYLPSLEPKRVYQMKGGCKVPQQRVMKKESAQVAPVSKYGEEVRKKVIGRSFISYRDPRDSDTVSRLLWRQSAIGDIEKLLDDKRLVSKWLISQRVFNTQPIDSVIPSTAYGNMELERLYSDPATRKTLNAQLQTIVEKKMRSDITTSIKELKIDLYGNMAVMTPIIEQGDVQLLPRALLREQISLLRKRYVGTANSTNLNLYSIADRYSSYQNNRYLSPLFTATIERLYGPSTELFSAPFLANTNHYYSPQGAADAVFGSQDHPFEHSAHLVDRMAKGGVWTVFMPESDYYFVTMANLIKQALGAATVPLMIVLSVFDKHLIDLSSLNPPALIFNAKEYSLAHGAIADTPLTLYFINNKIEGRDDNYLFDEKAATTMRETLAIRSEDALPSKENVGTLIYDLLSYQSVLLPNSSDRHHYLRYSLKQNEKERNAHVQRIFDLIVAPIEMIPPNIEDLTPDWRLQLFKLILSRSLSYARLVEPLKTLVGIEVSKSSMTNISTLNSQYELLENFLASSNQETYSNLLELLSIV